jgi:hypothetical protein
MSGEGEAVEEATIFRVLYSRHSLPREAAERSGRQDRSGENGMSGHDRSGISRKRRGIPTLLAGG